MEYKFKVGDRVIGNKLANAYGIIKQGWMGKVTATHSNGFIADGCYFLDYNSFDLISSKPANKIVITADNNTTLARLYDGNKVVKSAEAKCSPDDTYDFATGANLAYGRLMRLPEDPKKEEPKYYSGKVVCVISGKEGLTKGKVYEVKNGYMTDDNKYQRPSLLNRPKSIDDDFLVDWFIEYKGEQA